MPHPHTPAGSIRSVEAALAMTAPGEVLLTFRITPAVRLAVPEPASPARADGLWKRTCCELFLKPASADPYFEFNLSPSGQWAAYAFDGYRAGMRDLELPADPQIEHERQGEALILKAQVDLPPLQQGRMQIGLSAVIEETDGTKSYWALAHPPGKPDFHHQACFAAELAAPANP